MTPAREGGAHKGTQARYRSPRGGSGATAPAASAGCPASSGYDCANFYRH